MKEEDIKKLKFNTSNLVKQRNESITKALINSGVGKDFFSNLNKGQTPSIDKIMLLADYFGVTMDFLLGRTRLMDTQAINNNGTVEINGTQANVVNNSKQSLDEMSTELLKRFNSLSFDEKIDVFNYIKDKKSMVLK